MVGTVRRRHLRPAALLFAVACAFVIAGRVLSRQEPRANHVDPYAAFTPPALARLHAVGTLPSASNRGACTSCAAASGDGSSAVVIKEDYTLAAIFLVLGGILSYLLPFVGFGIGGFIFLLGVLFLVQTTRVRFVFDPDAIEVKVGSDSDDPEKLTKSGENFAVGGENRWKYNSFVNWEFFPKGFVEQGLPPVLVYFKETQTPQDQWGVGPGTLANSEEAIAGGAVPGQVHFFPCICDAQQLKSQFETRGCKKLTTS